MTIEKGNQAAMGAGGTISLGGRTLVVMPLSVADDQLLYNELRRQCIAESKSPLAAIAEDLKLLDDESRRIAIQAAVALQGGDGKSEPTSSKIAARVGHIDGTRFHLWLLVRSTHSDVTLEDVGKWVTKDNLSEVQAGIMEALEPEKKSPEGPHPVTSPMS